MSAPRERRRAKGSRGAPTFETIPSAPFSQAEQAKGAEARRFGRPVLLELLAGGITPGILRMWLGPGEPITARMLQNFRSIKPADLIQAGGRVEIEFSCEPADLYPGATGGPEDYRLSAIRTALALCQGVVLARDISVNGQLVQSHCWAANSQVVFRSPSHLLEPWKRLLSRELGAGRRVVIVEPAETLASS
ncbi:hypothetical protein FHS85_005146 [Rhodoligotrophos appendicifer]